MLYQLNNINRKIENLMESYFESFLCNEIGCLKYNHESLEESWELEGMLCKSQMDIWKHDDKCSACTYFKDQDQYVDFI